MNDEGRFLLAAVHDDVIGVQNCFRTRIEANGLVQPLPFDRMTDLWEFYPRAWRGGLDAYEVTGGVPVLVTENRIPTTDDVRTEYLEKALAFLAAAILRASTFVATSSGPHSATSSGR